MFGAYSNLKNRLFPHGEKESPFLEELRDESIAREMEEWNFRNTDNDDSTLDESGPKKGPTPNPFGPPREKTHDESNPFGRHNHGRHHHSHHENGNTAILNLTHFMKVFMLLLGVITIIFIVESTEAAMAAGCGRPNAAQYALVILFFSIAANLCVLTICERYNLCCTIGRMEFYFHVLGVIFVGVAIPVYGYWLYSVHTPYFENAENTTTPTMSVPKSPISALPNAVPTINSIMSVSISTTSVSVASQSVTARIETTLQKPPSDVPKPTPTTAMATLSGTNFTIVDHDAGNSTGNSTTNVGNETKSSARVKKHLDLAQSKDGSSVIYGKKESSLNISPPASSDVCMSLTISRRQFIFSVFVVFFLVVIATMHGTIVFLYFSPCMGLMGRDNQARATARANFALNYHHDHHHNHRHDSHAMEMRDRNNNSGTGAEPDTLQDQPELHRGMHTKPLIVKEHRFMTSSPNATPAKNMSLLKKVAQSNMWGSSRNPETKSQIEEKLHDSIISADQLLETSIEEESDLNVSTAAVVEVNTTGDGDDVLFDAHDSALLHVVVKSAQQIDKQNSEAK